MTATVKGLWTKKELAEAHRLAEACQANEAHWAFADWLLAKEPIVASGGLGSGMTVRLEVLAAELDTTFPALQLMRLTAYAWPAEHRVLDASFSAHEHCRRGGPAKAAKRADGLRERPRNRFGKVRSSKPGDARWHVVVGQDVHAAVVAEAAVSGVSIRVATEELINEALGARAWLAAEEAA